MKKNFYGKRFFRLLSWQRYKVRLDRDKNKKKSLFRQPIFYFIVYKTLHNLFLGVYFSSGRLIANATSGLAGYSGKKGLSPATSRIIAKLLIEKFYKHPLVARYSLSRFIGRRRYGFYFKRNFISFLRKKLYLHKKFLRNKLFFLKKKLRLFKLKKLKKFILRKFISFFLSKWRFRALKNFLRLKLKFYFRLLLRKKVINQPVTFFKAVHRFRSFKNLQKYRRSLRYLKIFSFGRFYRRFYLLIRTKGRNLHFRKNFYLHYRARLYKVRRFNKQYKKIPLSLFCVNCYPDQTIKAALRTIVSNVPFFSFLVSSIPVAHNGIRGPKIPRK